MNYRLNIEFNCSIQLLFNGFFSYLRMIKNAARGNSGGISSVLFIPTHPTMDDDHEQVNNDEEPSIIDSEITNLQNLLTDLSTPLEEPENVEQLQDDNITLAMAQKNTLTRTLLPMRNFVSKFNQNPN